MNKLILDSVIEQAIKDCIESVSYVVASKYDSYGANDVYEIEYKSRDGFISHNNGGFICDIMGNLSSVLGSGDYIHQGVKDCADRQYQECVDSFCNEHNIDEKSYGAIEQANLLDEYYQYEQDYFYDDCYFITIRALYLDKDNYYNKLGYSHVVFDIAYNLDNYGRECYCKNIAEIVVNVDDLTLDKISDIEKQLLKNV